MSQHSTTSTETWWNKHWQLVVLLAMVLTVIVSIAYIVKAHNTDEESGTRTVISYWECDRHATSLISPDAGPGKRITWDDDAHTPGIYDDPTYTATGTIDIDGNGPTSSTDFTCTVTWLDGQDYTVRFTRAITMSTDVGQGLDP